MPVSVSRQTNTQNPSQTIVQSATQYQQMSKTGIASIDKFFSYGYADKFQRVPFIPLLPKVLYMFESEYTASLHDRKANAVIKYCQYRSQGFFYEYIEGLTVLMGYLEADLFKGVFEMCPAILAIIDVDTGDSNSLFNRSAGSDYLRYLRFAPAWLNSFYYVLAYCRPLLRYHESLPITPNMYDLRAAVVDYLIKFAYRQIPYIIDNEYSFYNQTVDLTNPISPIQILLAEGTKHLRSIYQSSILEPVLDLLKDHRNQPSLTPLMLELLSYMMMYSKLAEELCRRGVLPLVVYIMLLCYDFRSGLVKTGFEILWNAVYGVGAYALAVLASQEYVTALRGMLIRVINEGYKLEDKCLRNELVILVNYLLALPEAVPLFLHKENSKEKEEKGKYYKAKSKTPPLDSTNPKTAKKATNFLYVLFEYSIIDESVFYDCKSRVTDSKVTFGTNSEDLYLKKLLWSGLLTAIESGHEYIIALAQRCSFIKYLLLYIDSANKSYAVTRWSSPQLRELQQHALSVLSNVILHMKDDFEEKKGIFCLTKFLSNVNDIERREKCLKAFFNASLFDYVYKTKISEEGLIDYLLEFLQGEENPIEIKYLCFTIIANLCKDCKKNKKLFREKHGVDIVIGDLKDQNIATSNRYLLLGISLLNCLWNAVLGSRRSYERFLNSQGLFNLLEFVEVCEYSHRKMALSCLSYLTENQKAVSEFLDWNSYKTMINATQLMVRLYTYYDDKYGVKYDNGIITNKQKPLTPNSGKKTLAEVAYLKDFTYTGTYTYLVNRIRYYVEQYDIRMIVFSILFRVGFSKNDLNASEQQKIEAIQMYPHFKIGYIWCYIDKQLKEYGIDPTEDDKHWMETAIEYFEYQVGNCITAQQIILRYNQKAQYSELNNFYQVIKNNKPIK